MYLSNEKIDEIAEQYGLYGIQDGGQISKSDFHACVDQLCDILQQKLEDNQ